MSPPMRLDGIRAVRGCWVPALSALTLCLAPSSAGVFSYECNQLPDAAGWSVLQLWCTPSILCEAGQLVAHVQLCEGQPPPGGQDAVYSRSLQDFDGVQTFFMQWRVITDADASEMSWGGGASLSAFSFGGTNYRFSISRDQAELNRDNLLPIASTTFEAGVPHVYRLELVGAASYAWFVDGQLVDAGVPEGPFPSSTPNIGFRTKAAFLPNTTQWDYIRYGTIPADGSGDFDSSGAVDANDVYFFLDCLLGPDSAGPGCRWADMNHDGVANAADIQQFVAALAH